jgi:hypothetical protein
VKAALAYPMVMVIAGTGAVIVMFTFVVPKITKTFEQLGQTLPAITQVLIAISTVMEHYWWAVIAAIAAAAVGFIKFTDTTDGRELWHTTQLKLPIVGDIVQKREVARFARTLGSLLKNGVSILTALEIVREVVNNVVFQARDRPHGGRDHAGRNGRGSPSATAASSPPGRREHDRHRARRRAACPKCCSASASPTRVQVERHDPHADLPARAERSSSSMGLDRRASS